MNEKIIQYVLREHPHTNGNNTEICLYVWQEVAKRRGVSTHDWLEMRSIIREYKPESITRKRRELVDSTQAQRVKEEEYIFKYANS